MRKILKIFATALISALLFISCEDNSSSDNSSSSKVFSLDSKKVGGDLSAPVGDTWNLTTSDGDRFEFEKSSASADFRAASGAGGIWSFFKKGSNVAAYKGTYTGELGSTLNLIVVQVVVEGTLANVNGTVEFTLSVTSVSFSATIPALSATSASSADGLVDDAVQLLCDADYDKAYLKIKQAYAKDSGSDRVKIFYTIAQVAHAAIDSDVQSLMSEKFGVVGYPASLNSLFSGCWGDADWLISYDGMTFPKLKEPAWIASNKWYKATFRRDYRWYYDPSRGYVEEPYGDYYPTPDTLTWRIYANLADLCPNGLNEVVSEVRSILEKKYSEIKKLVESIGDGSATLPASFVKTARMDSFFGEGDVTLTKAEMNLFLAFVELSYAGANFAASYNFDAKLSSLKKTESESTAANILNAVKNAASSATFAVKNASRLDESKKLCLSAIDRLNNAYDSILKSPLYSTRAKDNIKDKLEIYRKGLSRLETVIENKGVFYIPKNVDDWKGLGWPNTYHSEDTIAFGIDMGKIFEPGAFSNILERNSDGTLKIYCYDSKDKSVKELTSFTDEDFSKYRAEAGYYVSGQEEYTWTDWNGIKHTEKYNRYRYREYHIGPKVSKTMVESIIKNLSYDDWIDDAGVVGPLLLD